MRIRSRIIKLIAITLAVAAIAVIGSIGWKTEAQGGILFVATDVGVYVPGQSLRYSVGHLRVAQEGREPILAAVTLYDAQGNVLARSREVEVLPDQFHTFRFNRDDLAVEGEPGTGRLAVRGEITCRVTANPQQIRPEKFPIVRELVDNESGRTLDIHTHGLHISGDGNADNVIDR